VSVPRRFSGRSRKGPLTRSLVSLVVAVAFLGLSPSAANAAAPVFLRTLGGPNHAEMYPGGLEVAPGGGLVIADTANNTVEKYSAAGTQLWRVGTYGSGTNQFWNPRDVGISSDGTVYVDDTRNNRIVTLDGATGAWENTFSGPTGNKISFALGVSVHTTAAGERVYVADSGKNKVRVFDLAGNQLNEFKITSGACTFQDVRDADADAAGNIYVANYKAHNVVKLSPTGTCLTSWTTGTQANNTPYGVRVATDPFLGELVYVALGNENRVEIWTKSGTLVTRFGGKGTATQPGTFYELRRVAVAADGDVWGADLWGWRIERWDRTSGAWTYAQSIGTPLPADTDTRVFHETRGIAFEADGTVNIVDTNHHRFVRMTPAGHIINSCGVRGSNVGQFNWPRGQAVDLATGNIWVANTKQYNIHVINPTTCGGAGANSKFGTFGTGVGQFNWPYDIAIRQSDRIAFIADTNNHRIVTYDVATRTYISTFGTQGIGTGQFKFPSAVDIDPANGHLLVADSGNNRIVELSDTGGKNLQVTNTFTGGFTGPDGVAADANGDIYVADTGNNRVVILSPAGSVLESFSGPTGLNHPEAIAVAPNGEIYVADTYNDRVQVFAAYAGGGAPDTTPPDATLSVPTQDQAFSSVPVQMNGNATDNVGVASVKIAVKDRTTGLWYRANGTWGSFQQQLSVLGSPNAASTTWSFAWTPAPGGSGAYAVQVTAFDLTGNIDPTKPYIRFSVS
jgi:DNA-binding beta-propeller fold protein YncE